jgi:hypothetical protein
LDLQRQDTETLLAGWAAWGDVVTHYAGCSPLRLGASTDAVPARDHPDVEPFTRMDGATGLRSSQSRAGVWRGAAIDPGALRLPRMPVHSRIIACFAVSANCRPAMLTLRGAR